MNEIVGMVVELPLAFWGAKRINAAVVIGEVPGLFFFDFHLTD
jgi:hypothetical protein